MGNMEIRAGGKTARIGVFPKHHLKITLLSGVLDVYLKGADEIRIKHSFDTAGVCFDENVSQYLSFQFESLQGARFEYELN